MVLTLFVKGFGVPLNFRFLGGGNGSGQKNTLFCCGKKQARQTGITTYSESILAEQLGGEKHGIERGVSVVD